MNRRHFLLGVSAAALAPALPAMPLAALPTVTAPPAPVPAQLAFVVGTPGEFNWSQVWAATAEEAIEEWCSHNGYDDPEDMPEIDTQRMPSWDDLFGQDITSGMWIEAGIGHTCSRCHEECFPEDGAESVAGAAVCDPCLTLADKFALAHRRDEMIEELAEYIADNSEEEAKAWLGRAGAWDAAEDDHWPAAVAMAAEQFV